MLSGVRHSPLGRSKALSAQARLLTSAPRSTRSLTTSQVSRAAGLDQRILVAWNDFIDVGSLVQQQLDDVGVSFARGHDERIPVAGDRDVWIGAAAEKHAGGLAVSLARRGDERRAVTQEHGVDVRACLTNRVMRVTFPCSAAI